MITSLVIVFLLFFDGVSLKTQKGVSLSPGDKHTHSFHYFLSLWQLLALVAILAQSLLALVGSHLVALLLFSVWHNSDLFKMLITSFSQ